MYSLNADDLRRLSYFHLTHPNIPIEEMGDRFLEELERIRQAPEGRRERLKRKLVVKLHAVWGKGKGKVKGFAGKMERMVSG